MLQQNETISQLEMFTPHSRTYDPLTSKMAGVNAVTLRAGSQKVRLLEAYARAGSDGLTADEAGDLTGLSAIRNCCYWKRISELAELHLLEDTDAKRMSQAGEWQMVRRITELGLLVISEQ